MKPTLAVAVLLLTVGTVPAEDTKKLLQDLEGSYTPVTMTRGGEAAPDEFVKAVSFVIKGDTLTVRFKKNDKGEDKEATIVLLPDQKPTGIDLTPKDGPDANKPMLGIIKTEKDTVTLCWTDQGDKAERPKDFTSTKENRQFLIVMKKTK